MDEVEARGLLQHERDLLSALRAGEAVTAVEGQAADAGSETADRTRDLGTIEELERDLAEIDAALRRLEEGTYGLCEVCGRPIPDERLAANPTARYDIEHQRVVESGAL